MLLSLPSIAGRVVGTAWHARHHAQRTFCCFSLFAPLPSSSSSGISSSSTLSTSYSTFTFVATMGNGDYGRLGHGEACENVEVPRICSKLLSLKNKEQDVAGDGGGDGGGMVDICKISSGGAHTLLLDKEGQVYSMGLNERGQLGQGTEEPYVCEPRKVKGISSPVKEVAAGRDHSVCISVDGRVWVSGCNKKGKLGLGRRSAGMYDTFEPNEYLSDHEMSKVALGAGHTLTLSKNGEIFSWGSSSYGVLGHGMSKTFVFIRSKDEWVPRKLQALDDTKIRSIVAGDSYSGCIDSNGRVYTWGQGSFWKLGLEKDVDVWYPQQVEGLHFVKKLAFGFSHSMALTYNGDVYVWGTNESGCLGLGRNDGKSKNKRNTRHPLKLELEDDIVDISCGWKHSAAVTRDGKLLTWGWGGSMGTSSMFDSGGQLGHNNAFDYWEPTVAAFPSLSLTTEEGKKEEKAQLVADAVSCGFNHTTALYSYCP